MSRRSDPAATARSWAGSSAIRRVRSRASRSSRTSRSTRGTSSTGRAELRELRSRQEDLAAPGALDDHVDRAPHDLHPVRVGPLRVTLPLEGREIRILDFGDEPIRGSRQGDPERRLRPATFASDLVELLRCLEVLGEVPIAHLNRETSTDHRLSFPQWTFARLLHFGAVKSTIDRSRSL